MYYRSPEGWGLYEENWSVKTLCNMYSRGVIDYNSRVQRGLKWQKPRASKYIHSLLWGMLAYNPPQLYSKQGKIYYSIDGKQRSNTLISYVNNEYAITGLKDEKYLLNINGEIYNINGKRFSQLPEELKEKILDFQIHVVILEDAPNIVEAEFFERANSGIAVSKTDISFAHNANSEGIVDITEHPLFATMYSNSKKDMSSYKKELVVQSWIVLNEENPVIKGNHLDEITKSLVMSDEDKVQLNAVYDTVLAAYKRVNVINKTLATTILNKTHLLSYLPFIDRFDDGKMLAKWLVYFYSNTPDEYNDVAKYRTNDTSGFNTRMKVISDSIDKFLLENSAETD